MVWTGYSEQPPFAGCSGNADLTADCVKQRTVSPAEPVLVSLQHSVISTAFCFLVVMEQVFTTTQKQTNQNGHVSSGVSPLPTDKLLVQSGLPNSLRVFTCEEVT